MIPKRPEAGSSLEDAMAGVAAFFWHTGAVRVPGASGSAPFIEPISISNGTIGWP